jgi:hypothetical protein
MGEPAGIGPDLILRLFANRVELGLPPFIVYGHIDFLRARAARLHLPVAMLECTPLEAAARFAEALPVVHVDGLVPDKPGDPTALSGKVVIEAISPRSGRQPHRGLSRHRYGADPQGSALRRRLQIPRPYRVPGGAVRPRRRAAHPGDDVGARGVAGDPRNHPRTDQRGAVAGDVRAGGEYRTDRRA